jgi:ATP-binding cassette subfamily A (ABC1) protein 1
MEKAALCLENYDQYFTGLVFPEFNLSVTELPPIVTYKIRHNSKLVDSKYYIDPPSNTLDIDNSFVDFKYLKFGFAFLQDALERIIVERQTNTTLRTGLYAQPEPYPNSIFDSFNVTIYLTLCIVLSFMTSASLLVKSIVYEKEKRLKEIMRM